MTTSSTATKAMAMYMVRLVANRLREDEVGTWPGVLRGGVFMASSMGVATHQPCRTSTGQGISAGQDSGVVIGASRDGLEIESHYNRPCTANMTRRHLDHAGVVQWQDLSFPSS